MRPTDEQVEGLALLERVHGRVFDVPPGSTAEAKLLAHSGEGTRVCHCLNCDISFLVELDGEIRAFKWSPADTAPKG